MHHTVQLVIGVPKAVGVPETLPASGPTIFNLEQDLIIIDLTSSTSFTLDPNGGWDPAMAALKDGGVWADNPLVTGRELVAGGDDNVTETMRISTTGDVYAHLNVLNRFVQSVRRFWTTDYQIDPPYIKWRAQEANKDQYALIYDISVAVSPPSGGDISPMDITLTIEREPYWRAEAPGANPKVYLFHRDNSSFDYNNYNLFTGTDFLGYSQFENRTEFTDTNRDTLLSQNFIEIPAEDIPGDAPALVCMTFVGFAEVLGEVTAYINRYLISRGTLPDDKFQHEQTLMLDNPSAFLVTDATLAADTGGLFDPSSGANRRLRVSFATTTTMSSRAVWGPDHFINELRGEFAVYCRCRQHNGSAGDVTIQISGNNGLDRTDPVSPTVLTGTGATAEWPTTYLGRISVPGSTNSNSLSFGYVGLSPDFSRITLYAARSTGTSELYICDVILIPLSEPSFEILSPFTIPADTLAPSLIVDNTGYMAHGKPGLYGEFPDFGAYGGPQEIRGQEIMLIPGVDNRLYFFGMDSDLRSVPACEITVRLSIIPRWIGVRDD